MSFQNPSMVVVAILVGVALGGGYYYLQRRRARTLASSGLLPAKSGWAAFRRHVPPILFLTALTLLLIGVARPQATVPVPRQSGTVILAFDISNSMAAKDIGPSRLGAAQAAAVEFVKSQPDTVQIGVVAFGQGAQTTQLPTNDRDSTINAINRLKVAGGTSLGHAILGSLTAITGQPASVSPDEPATDLGFWPSATIVMLSDGEDTGGPDALAAADLAATAGVHIETIGVGTVQGTTIEVDGFQIATALNEELLTEIAETTTGSYHRAEDAESLGNVYKTLDLRITMEDEFLELTSVVLWIAILLLLIGGLLMITWFGRIV